MERYINIFITKLWEKIKMYFAFLIYLLGGISYSSIDKTFI